MDPTEKELEFYARHRAKLIAQGILVPDPHHPPAWRPNLSPRIVKDLRERLVKSGLLTPGGWTFGEPLRVVVKTH